jgi:hypothetical protein
MVSESSKHQNPYNFIITELAVQAYHDHHSNLFRIKTSKA